MAEDDLPNPPPLPYPESWSIGANDKDEADRHEAGEGPLMIRLTFAASEKEGLKRWLPGRTQGYAQLSAAVDRFGTIDSFVKGVASQCK